MIAVSVPVGILFPSPQGGSETMNSLSEVRQHLSFHPLKAGRRLLLLRCDPQRRQEFPSPQGGSETISRFVKALREFYVSIPSRRVGDRTSNARTQPAAPVSIPSRRVGDWIMCFHFWLMR